MIGGYVLVPGAVVVWLPCASFCPCTRPVRTPPYVSRRTRQYAALCQVSKLRAAHGRDLDAKLGVILRVFFISLVMEIRFFYITLRLDYLDSNEMRRV